MLQRVQNAVPGIVLSRPLAGQDVSTGFSRLQVAVALLGGLAVLAALMGHAGLSITWNSRSNLPFVLAGAVALAVRHDGVMRGWRHAAAVRDGAAYYAIFTAIALTGAVASYPIAALTHGYADPMLQRIDAAMGFDWLAWYRIVAEHRLLQRLGVACYQSIYLTPAILLGWFALTGARREAHRFLGGFWLAAVLTLALFALMPAVGPLSFLWHAPIAYLPVSETWQSDLIPALRAHRVHTIDLGELRGLVSAPSFHAAAGTLYLRSAWRTPFLRWPLVTLVAAMLLATPVEGTHYLIDMMIGVVVALIAMEIVDLALARRG